MIFHTSIMMTVATAGEPTASVDADNGECIRTAGESMPMLMAVPRLAPLYDPLLHAYAPPYPHAPPPPPLPPNTPPPLSTGWLWRLSGAPGSFAMLGLGDIVLPSLAITFARRVDLALSHHLKRRGDSSPRNGGGAASSSSAAVGCGGGPSPWAIGYYPCAVLGYALGLGLTLAANAYGWTFNNVQGQPALLYLVPGVIGALLLRAACRGELAEIWTGRHLPRTDENGAVDADGASSGAVATDAQTGPLLSRNRARGWCCDYKEM